MKNSTDFLTINPTFQTGAMLAIPGDDTGPVMLFNGDTATPIYLSRRANTVTVDNAFKAPLNPQSAIVFDNKEPVYAMCIAPPPAAPTLYIIPGAIKIKIPFTIDSWHTIQGPVFGAPLAGNFEYIALSGSQTQLVMVNWSLSFASATLNNGTVALAAGNLPAGPPFNYVPPNPRWIPGTIAGNAVPAPGVAYAPALIGTDGSVTYEGPTVTAGVAIQQWIGQGIYELAVG